MSRISSAWRPWTRLAFLAATLAAALPLDAQEPKQACTCTCAVSRPSGEKIVLSTIEDAACKPCETSCCETLCGPIIKQTLNRRKEKKAQAEAAREAVVKTAAERVGSEAWAYAAKPKNTWKCNKFVFDTLNAAGAEVPKVRGWPPMAGQWADPEVQIPGWVVVTGEPKPGDVVARAHRSVDASGHVAIVVGPGRSVGAHEDATYETDFGFRAGQTYTFRRYVGAP